MDSSIAGIKIPDSKMARDVTQLIRDTEPDLLFHHSTRVYLFGALTGARKKLKFDPELLYVGAMFHDIGLTETFRDSKNRFEVDSANSARDFMRSYGIPEQSIELVWDAIALHTTPGFPSTRSPKLRSSRLGLKWMYSASRMSNSRKNSAKLSSWPIPAACILKTTSSTLSIPG